MSAGRAAADPLFTALVLAGSRGPDDPVARAAGVAHKCLVPVAGVPMAVRVVETLAACPSVGRIALALEDPALLDDLPALRPLIAAGRCTALATGATPSLSVQRALDELPDPLPLLVTTGDHPLLTPEMVEHFCAAARTTGADLVAGLTPSSAIRKAYPDAQRTYLRFRDERYSGANLYALLGPDARRAVAFWRRVEQERKRPWRLVRAFGWRPLLGLSARAPHAGRCHGARLGHHRRAHRRGRHALRRGRDRRRQAGGSGARRDDSRPAPVRSLRVRPRTGTGDRSANRDLVPAAPAGVPNRQRLIQSWGAITMKRIGVLVCAFVLVASVAWGRSLPTVEPEKVGLSSERLQRIAQVFQQEIDQGRLPGAIVLIARKGEVAYFESFGFRDKAANAPMPKDAIFRIYSMTKPLVSVAAMILMEEGRLQLADPVSKFLPDFAELEVSVPKTDTYGKVTYTLVPAERPIDRAGPAAPYRRACATARSPAMRRSRRRTPRPASTSRMA